MLRRVPGMGRSGFVGAMGTLTLTFHALIVPGLGRRVFGTSAKETLPTVSYDPAPETGREYYVAIPDF